MINKEIETWQINVARPAVVIARTVRHVRAASVVAAVALTTRKARDVIAHQLHLARRK